MGKLDVVGESTEMAQASGPALPAVDFWWKSDNLYQDKTLENDLKLSYICDNKVSYFC